MFVCVRFGAKLWLVRAFVSLTHKSEKSTRETLKWNHFLKKKKYYMQQSFIAATIVTAVVVIQQT